MWLFHLNDAKVTEDWILCDCDFELILQIFLWVFQL